MDISGRMYIVVGVFVTGYSFFVTLLNKETPVSKFSVFILAGIGFILFGIFRWLTESKKVSKKVPIQVQRQNRQQVKSHGPIHRNVKYCANCGTVSNFNDRFCRMCGGHHFYRK